MSDCLAEPPGGSIRDRPLNRPTTALQRAAVLTLRSYKAVISPLLPASCRFHPTCSDYAREAIERHGLALGSWLAVKRLARCHPFSPGGCDPVPQ